MPLGVNLGCGYIVILFALGVVCTHVLDYPSFSDRLVTCGLFSGKIRLEIRAVGLYCYVAEVGKPAGKACSSPVGAEHGGCSRRRGARECPQVKKGRLCTGLQVLWLDRCCGLSVATHARDHATRAEACRSQSIVYRNIFFYVVL